MDVKTCAVSRVGSGRIFAAVLGSVGQTQEARTRLGLLPSPTLPRSIQSLAPGTKLFLGPEPHFHKAFTLMKVTAIL